MRKRRRLRTILAACGWTLLMLILVDAAVQFAFPMPDNPRVAPRSMAQYFNYGRSIDGKLAQIVRATDAQSSPIVAAGWLKSECKAPPPPSPGKTGVSIYGMSFSEHVAQHLGEIDPTLSIETFSGPGANLNHSYACYKMISATGKDPNRIQIIGILAHTVDRMLTLGGLTTSFEAPQPFTYPRYHLVNGRLEAIEPIVRGPADLRDPAKMRAYVAQLAREDAFYDPLLMHDGLLDRSAVFRMLRRAYGQARSRELEGALVNNGTDYLPNPELGPVMRAMLRDFAQSARGQGKIPIVILFQDRGMGTDSLYRMLGAELEQDGISVVRTDQIASAADPRNFIADGHFTPLVDRKIAEAVDAEIKRFAGRAP